jgi:hypothetical protein
MDPFVEERINETKQLIQSNPKLQDLILNNQTFYNQIRNYSFEQLMAELQPKWNNQKSLSEDEGKKLALLIIEYRSRGFDIEYLINGAGAPNNCLIS